MSLVVSDGCLSTFFVGSSSFDVASINSSSSLFADGGLLTAVSSDDSLSAIIVGSFSPNIDGGSYLLSSVPGISSLFAISGICFLFPIASNDVLSTVIGKSLLSVVFGGGFLFFVDGGSFL